MRKALACATALLASGCASVLSPLPSATPPVETPFGAGTIAEAPATPPTPNPSVGAVIVPGHTQTPAPPAAGTPVRRGKVSLNYPGVDVQAVAKGVLGDLLGLSYTLAPDIHTPVTLAPGRPIASADVLRVFEEALRNANLALVQQGAGYAILPVDQAKAVAPVGDAATPGFMSEAVSLQFVNADALRRLIDPVLPGVVTGADASSNVLTIAGTEGQRASARDLIRQFDVNWLRGASFALFTPRRTDSRLIAPELDKLLNADGAPTKGLVRLIAMDRINGILAVSTQPQYLEDVRRWVEILDREGESNQRRLFVYRVQNGRSSDLAKVLISAFGAGGSAPGGWPVRRAALPGQQPLRRHPRHAADGQRGAGRRPGGSGCAQLRLRRGEPGDGRPRRRRLQRDLDGRHLDGPRWRRRGAGRRSRSPGPHPPASTSRWTTSTPRSPATRPTTPSSSTPRLATTPWWRTRCASWTSRPTR